MSEEHFKKAKGDLAFSQQLVDQHRQQQQSEEMPQEALESAPEAPPEAPVQETAPQPEVAPLTPPTQAPQSDTTEESPVGLLEKSGKAMQEAFHSITQAFAKTEEKKAKETKALETKFTTELKGLKENIRKIVEE